MIRIVIAEDQQLVLGALATVLALDPAIEVVGRAGNGRAALDLVLELDPDVLVTDIEMPEMSGLEAAQLLRQQGRRTKVLVVTTFERRGYLRRAMDLGVRGYVLKDIPSDSLAEAIRTIASGGRMISPELAEAAWASNRDPLTAREREILRLAQKGRSNKEIGRELNLSPGTVRNYLSEAAQKLEASNRIEAVLVAQEQGWL